MTYLIDMARGGAPRQSPRSSLTLPAQVTLGSSPAFTGGAQLLPVKQVSKPSTALEAAQEPGLKPSQSTDWAGVAEWPSHHTTRLVPVLSLRSLSSNEEVGESQSQGLGGQLH